MKRRKNLSNWGQLHYSLIRIWIPGPQYNEHAYRFPSITNWWINTKFKSMSCVIEQHYVSVFFTDLFIVCTHISMFSRHKGKLVTNQQKCNFFVSVSLKSEWWVQITKEWRISKRSVILLPRQINRCFYIKLPLFHYSSNSRKFTLYF